MHTVLPSLSQQKLLRLTPFLKKAHTACGLLIKKPEASWALRLPARPGRLKARLKALGLAGPVSNTGELQIVGSEHDDHSI